MSNEEEIKRWYNQKHRSGGHETWRPFEAYPVILDYLEVEAGKKILDVGCGTGYLLKAAEKRGLETFGIDISEEGIQIAKEVSPNSNLYTGRAENLEFPDNYFDYVVCLGALEHFLSIETSLEEMIRVGKESATFCFLVPNKNYLFWKLKRSKGTEQQEINEKLYSLDRWEKIFSGKGLQIHQIHRDLWRLREWEVFNSLNLIKILNNALYNLVFWLLPLQYTYQFIFILRNNN